MCWGRGTGQGSGILKPRDFSEVRELLAISWKVKRAPSSQRNPLAR